MSEVKVSKTNVFYLSILQQKLTNWIKHIFIRYRSPAFSGTQDLYITFDNAIYIGQLDTPTWLELHNLTISTVNNQINEKSIKFDSTIASKIVT